MMLKHSAPSWGPPRSASNMSPSRWGTRSRHPGLGDDLAPDRGAARQVDDRRAEPGVAAAERHRELAVAAGDVEQRVRARRERDRLRDLVAREPRELVLAADVGVPVRVVGGAVVHLDRLAVAEQALETVPPLPVAVVVGEEVAEVAVAAGLEPAPRRAATARSARRAAERGRAPRARRGRSVVGSGCSSRRSASSVGALRALGERGEDPGPLRDLQRARHRHREHRLADRRRQLVGAQRDPLDSPSGIAPIRIAA